METYSSELYSASINPIHDNAFIIDKHQIDDCIPFKQSELIQTQISSNKQQLINKENIEQLIENNQFLQTNLNESNSNFEFNNELDKLQLISIFSPVSIKLAQKHHQHQPIVEQVYDPESEFLIDQKSDLHITSSFDSSPPLYYSESSSGHEFMNNNNNNNNNMNSLSFSSDNQNLYANQSILYPWSNENVNQSIIFDNTNLPSTTNSLTITPSSSVSTTFTTNNNTTSLFMFSSSATATTTTSNTLSQSPTLKSLRLIQTPPTPSSPLLTIQPIRPSSTIGISPNWNYEHYQTNLQNECCNFWEFNNEANSTALSLSTPSSLSSFSSASPSSIALTTISPSRMTQMGSQPSPVITLLMTQSGQQTNNCVKLPINVETNLDTFQYHNNYQQYNPNLTVYNHNMNKMNNTDITPTINDQNNFKKNTNFTDDQNQSTYDNLSVPTNSTWLSDRNYFENTQQSVKTTDNFDLLPNSMLKTKLNYVNNSSELIYFTNKKQNNSIHHSQTYHNTINNYCKYCAFNQTIDNHFLFSPCTTHNQNVSDMNSPTKFKSFYYCQPNDQQFENLHHHHRHHHHHHHHRYHNNNSNCSPDTFDMNNNFNTTITPTTLTPIINTTNKNNNNNNNNILIHPSPNQFIEQLNEPNKRRTYKRRLVTNFHGSLDTKSIFFHKKSKNLSELSSYSSHSSGDSSCRATSSSATTIKTTITRNDRSRSTLKIDPKLIDQLLIPINYDELIKIMNNRFELFQLIQIKSDPTNTLINSVFNNNQIQMKLRDQEIWSSMYSHCTEMIATNTGRRIFPSLSVEVKGLCPTDEYIFVLDMILTQPHIFKHQGGKWVISGQSEMCLNSTLLDGKFYIQEDSPKTGAYWMESGVNFTRAKITNSKELKFQNNMIHVYSMHHYIPRFTILRLNRNRDPSIPMHLHLFSEKNIDLIGSYVIPGTQFYTVTAYQNPDVIRIKINHNPFAKGFRNKQDSDCFGDVLTAMALKNANQYSHHF